MTHDYWNKKASTYESFYWLDKTAQKTKRKCELIVGQFPENTKNVLEIGCGTGLLTKYLAERDYRIVAVDFSSEMIARAPKYPNVWYICDDAHSLHFNGNIDDFDVVVSLHSMQYLNIDIMLDAFYSFLRVSGKVCFIEVNALNPFVYIVTNIPLTRKLFGRSPVNKTYTRWGMEKKLKQHSFKSIGSQPVGYVNDEVISEVLESSLGIREFAGSYLVWASK